MENKEKDEKSIILKEVQKTQQVMQETQKQMQDSFQAMQETQKEMKDSFKKMQETQIQMQESFKKMQETQTQMQEKMDNGFANLQGQIDDIKTKTDQIDGINAEIKQIKLDIRQINKSVAVIEHDHGQKLSALFDAFTVLTEKSESHEDKIKSNQAHLEKHDDEIYYLKSKVQGL